VLGVAEEIRDVRSGERIDLRTRRARVVGHVTAFSSKLLWLSDRSPARPFLVPFSFLLQRCSVHAGRALLAHSAGTAIEDA
jgi:hypothetical protein